ncbi:holin [Lactovum miscens]|uniref:Uncharacterized protein n=1 Tax=Lactovum miscens TaxID=190387 RepID=A0A841C658_9LACT|nr:holin [Lactovum miscens]MBB5887757.1 hypothetical protein [Lactovum miscens]
MEKSIDLIVVLWNTGVISAIAIWAIRLLQAHTKNQRLKVLESYAGQAVSDVKDPANVTDDEMQVATIKLISLINQSGLKLKVPEDQAQALLKGAVNGLKSLLKVA